MMDAWIIDAGRTPRGIGKPGKGALADVHPQRLLSIVLRAMTERLGLDTGDIDDVIAGCGTQVGKQGSCIARMAALDAGFDVAAAGVTVDRFCGSGLTAINLAAMGVASGMQQLVMAGGVESMSFGASVQRSPFIDGDHAELRERVPQPHQGVAADAIATLEGFSREDVDGYACESQRRAAIAIEQGRFDSSIVPVLLASGCVTHDEYPRASTTVEGLAKLRPAFAELANTVLDEHGTTYAGLVRMVYPELTIDHVHHAGNSSGVVDGAAVVVIASPRYAQERGLKPRARIRSVATVGGDPTLMLNAPVDAARKAVLLADMTMADIDLFEVNEAFAAVPLKFMRDLQIDPERVNVNGGAIALGHPIGATGAILAGTLLDELERRDLSTGLVTLCTGGGMAPAAVIERI